MNTTLRAEIDKIVSDIAPPADAVGLLTAAEVKEIIRMAATQGVMAGWVAAEKATRTRNQK